MLRIEAEFPVEAVPPSDLSFGDLRVSGDLGRWSTGSRLQLVVSLIAMAEQLLAWCRSGPGAATLTSSEYKRLLELRDRSDGSVEVSGPAGPLHLAENRREVFLAFHGAVMNLLDRYPDLSWAVAEDDFWAAMASFRVQCLPGLALED